MNLKSYFKTFFLIGIFLSFLSLFFEWYSFQARNLEGELVMLWNFHLFMGWNTIFSPDAWFNEVFKPNVEQFPIIIALVYIAIMIITVYSVLFTDLEHLENFEKAKKYSYLHLFELILSGFCIAAVPIYYWISQELFFPYIVFIDFDLEVSFVYTIGIGYLLQCFAFVSLFPYSIYYYYTSTHFEKQDTTLEGRLLKILNQVQEPLDFDKLIGEERLKVQQDRSEDLSILEKEQNINHIYNKFIKLRGVK